MENSVALLGSSVFERQHTEHGHSALGAKKSKSCSNKMIKKEMNKMKWNTIDKEKEETECCSSPTWLDERINHQQTISSILFGQLNRDNISPTPRFVSGA